MKYQGEKIKVILLFAVFLGVGYAILSTKLNITGTTSVANNSWNIYFDNVQVAEGSVEAVLPEIDTNKTTVNYSIAFTSPGDYYEFTVDAVNDGTIDAMIDTITKTEFTEEILNYITYQITYDTGEEIKKGDYLESKGKVTYKVFLKYNEVNDLPEQDIPLDLTLSVVYVKADKKIEKTPMLTIIKETAQSDKDILFNTISSDTNGKGLYVRNGTENDTYPIYYYRGAVTNNNAIFADKCWKIVRTTEKGGTKLVYNGTTSNGKCYGSNVGNTTSKFTDSVKSIAYMGYMYGTAYEYATRSWTVGHLSGETFTYSNGTYTLVNTSTDYQNHNYRYTCFNKTGTCSELYFVYHMDFASGCRPYYITLKDGKSKDDALREMQENINDSLMKTSVDTWFEDNIVSWFSNENKSYGKYLEDSIWCNDRSMNTHGEDNFSVNSGWVTGGNTFRDLYYSAYGRKRIAKPSLICPQKNDAFTVSDTENGNGALTYPVGLLTSDEVILAGGQNENNLYYYLRNTNMWFTMSPNFYTMVSSYSDPKASMFFVDGSGKLRENAPASSMGTPTSTMVVRPSITIKSNVEIQDDGDGTESNPYVFIVK